MEESRELGSLCLMMTLHQQSRSQDRTGSEAKLLNFKAALSNLFPLGRLCHLQVPQPCQTVTPVGYSVLNR